MRVQHVVTESIRNGLLKGQIEIIDSDVVAVDNFVIEVLVDDKVLLECFSVSTNIPNLHFVKVKLPTTLFDDNYHRYELQVKNKITRADSSYERPDSVTTEWKHISGSFANGNFSAIPKISAYRYRAAYSGQSDQSFWS